MCVCGWRGGKGQFRSPYIEHSASGLPNPTRTLSVSDFADVYNKHIYKHIYLMYIVVKTIFLKYVQILNYS